MNNPYKSLPGKCFWRTGVTDRGHFKIQELWNPKFKIEKSDKVITAGSCFAQHISRALIANGYNWLNAEPAPPMLTEKSKKIFNYGVFSFRTGNIYTAQLLLQWVEWALDKQQLPEETWLKNDRFHDPMRPGIEPDGFSTRNEVKKSFNVTRNLFRKAVSETDIFVFTLGLTEAWRSKKTGFVYPSCPGVMAGEYNPSDYEFVNFSYPEIMEAMDKALDLIKEANPSIKILLTVSPVPLTATAEESTHVLTATTYSKSTLRAVAGDLARKYDFVDYFPSYEIITAPPFRGMFFEPNLRSVDSKGVEFVMGHFFSDMEQRFGKPQNFTDNNAAPISSEESSEDDDIVCEEMVLEFYNEN